MSTAVQPAVIADKRTHANVVRIAIAKYRLCAGVEHALATVGYKATVADALKSAGMSKRSFYELFSSMDDVILRMQMAVAPTMARLMSERGVDEKRAYELTTASFPMSELMLPLMGRRSVRITGFRCTGEATEIAIHTAGYVIIEGPRPAPSPKDTCIPNVMAWAKDLGRMGSTIGATQ